MRVRAALVSVLLLAATLCMPATALAQGQQVASYTFSPNPIAASGALAPGEAVTVTLTALDAQGDPVPGATVYLWLVSAVGGGGSAAVGAAGLTGSPQPFTAGPDGVVHLVYTAPDPIPAPSVHCQSSGETTRCNPNDEIMAADAPTSPGVGSGDAYTFPYAQTPSVSSAGGTLATDDGTFAAIVPAGAVPPDHALKVAEVAVTRERVHRWSLPSAALHVLAAFDLTTAPSGGRVSQALAATVGYRPQDLAGPPARRCAAQPCRWSSSRLALYEERAGAWTYLPTTVDGSASDVQAVVQAPGLLALVLDTTTLRDVPSGFWAGGAIDRLLAAGVVSGFPDGSFRPAAPVTRAEFAKMLVVALNIPLPDVGSGQPTFSDVAAGAWYAPYVAAAAGAGIVQGLPSGAFAGDAPVTREQMAAMVVRALHLSGGADLTFPDAPAIDPWALHSVEAAVAAGLMGGFPDGSFQPLAAATRAQAAAVVAAAMLQPPTPSPSSS